LVRSIRRQYSVEILSEHIPFAGNEYVYFFPEHTKRAREKAKEEALKNYKNYKNLSKWWRMFKFDEEGEKALLLILSLPFVREDDEAFKKLKSYTGAFNYLCHYASLKYIELDGKKYYSFWDYGLENAKFLYELAKELFM
jgi:hypothetical protein